MDAHLFHSLGCILNYHFGVVFKTRGGNEVHCVEDSCVKTKKLLFLRLYILSIEMIELIHSSHYFRTIFL